MPLDRVVPGCARLARALAALPVAPAAADALPVRLLDGSTLRLRPHGDISKHFPPHRTRRQKACWCVARTVVCFGAGRPVGFDPLERAGAGRALDPGGGHAWVRLTGGPAAANWRRPGLDLAVPWSPSAHDPVDRGLKKKAVAGCLVVVRGQRRGWRTQTLCLFTTLTDATAFAPAWLLGQYGRRWQVEVNRAGSKQRWDWGSWR